MPMTFKFHDGNLRDRRIEQHRRETRQTVKTIIRRAGQFCKRSVRTNFQRFLHETHLRQA